jgi:hypothetical protein
MLPVVGLGGRRLGERWLGVAGRLACLCAGGIDAKKAAALRISLARRSSRFSAAQTAQLHRLLCGHPGPLTRIDLGPAHPLATVSALIHRWRSAG